MERKSRSPSAGGKGGPQPAMPVPAWSSCFAGEEILVQEAKPCKTVYKPQAGPASRVCDKCCHTGLRTQEVPEFGLMFCYHPPKTLNI